jgi:hypothetical protein
MFIMNWSSISAATPKLRKSGCTPRVSMVAVLSAMPNSPKNT